MAASRTSAPTAADIAARTASRRINFAKIAEPMQAPNLLALQTERFDIAEVRFRGFVDCLDDFRGVIRVGIWIK